MLSLEPPHPTCWFAGRGRPSLTEARLHNKLLSSQVASQGHRDRRLARVESELQTSTHFVSGVRVAGGSEA